MQGKLRLEVARILKHKLLQLNYVTNLVFRACGDSGPCISRWILDVEMPLRRLLESRAHCTDRGVMMTDPVSRFTATGE